MLAKLSSKNQITLPKAVLQKIGDSEYFEVGVKDSRIVLTPVKIQQAEAVREKLTALGIKEGDVKNALAWARSKK
jgi:bifunctional DNA-binding transcriptional regulator/antitoxin component of YhaV-PrlF toxin-antitoxin module